MKKVFSIATIVVMLFVMAFPAFAVDDGNYPISFPNISSVKTTHRLVVYDAEDDCYYLHLLAGVTHSNVRFKVRIINSNVSAIGTGDGNVTYKLYRFKSGVDTDWTQVGNTSNYTSASAVAIPLADNDEMKYTNFAISTESGEPFFLQPTATLAQKVMCLIRREILTLNPTTARTMLTLTLCGVGCLAFLISLRVLPKALRRFLH